MISKGRKIYKILSAVFLLFVMITIFVLSHETSTESSQTSGNLIEFLQRFFSAQVSQDIIRTFGHFAEFGALGFTVFNCIYAFKNKKLFILSTVLSWIYALTDEIHQLFIPGRAFQLIDLLVDLLGIVLGIMFIFIIVSIIEKKLKKQYKY